MKVAFIGLGHMGAPMSRNLLAAGHDLVVHDLRAEAAAGLDVAITMLPAPPHVEEVLLGPDGLLGGLPPGAIWVDMSTSVPAVADKVRALAEPRGIAVLDAPVSGGVTGATAGTLQIFAGGTAESYSRVRPLLEVMGDPERILHVGPHGAGYTVKLMLNLLWFAHLVITAEVLTVGVKAGVDLAMLRRSLLASAAASHFLEHDVLSVLERGDFDDSFSVALACKDLGRAQYGDEGGQMLPMKLLEDLTRTPLRLSPPQE